ncbi:protein farnesyltransferase subunit beta [Phtheirospermum japonicum]|uniref:Protein farnesyltransferase subunit beta n=1 Tax=Phtheirospermum japonicum TaxID=374723 RepID=A0A830C901_9LAMI|nr:protein farnesyltransferase subunit beta [Phtheirospermum japonicum]
MENMRATKSQEEQWMVQDQVFRIYDLVCQLPPHAQSVNFELRRENHIEYLIKSLKQLGPNFAVLDANRPWLCYWIIHSIALLGDCVDDKLENDVIEFLQRCQNSNGGYGGGPGQMPHLATTYAAINTLITLGGHKSLSSINREKLYDFLLRMKDTSGGFRRTPPNDFGKIGSRLALGQLYLERVPQSVEADTLRMHDGGEVDVRACYTAISVASILNILDDRLIQNVGDYVVSCQTYEGGISGEPGTEAHGGYTFCGLAAMVLINEVNRLDLPGLINWVVFRQGVECGFQGRTNKLVDGCYSFWQGGVAAIIQRLHLMVSEQVGLLNTFESDSRTESDNGSSNSDGERSSEGASSPLNDVCQPIKEGNPNAFPRIGANNNGHKFIRGSIGMRPLFNSMALQQYILLCTQEEAGFRDKPGKRRDHYHTCYVLSGLSICQYSNIKRADSPPLPRDLLGPYSNLVEPVHPLHNIVLDKFYEAYRFFGGSAVEE